MSLTEVEMIEWNEENTKGVISLFNAMEPETQNKVDALASMLFTQHHMLCLPGHDELPPTVPGMNEQLTAQYRQLALTTISLVATL